MADDLVPGVHRRYTLSMTRVVMALCALLLAPSCVTAGASRVLGFSYRTGTPFAATPVVRPIAVEHEMDIIVYAPRAGAPAPVTVWGERRYFSGDVDRVHVTEATSSDQQVLAVVAIDGHRVRVRGLRPGSSQLRVVTPRGVDTVTVTVAELARASVTHAAWERLETPSRTVFVAGGVTHLQVERTSPTGQQVTGYGLLKAIDIGPLSVAEPLDRPEDIWQLRVRFSRPGQMTVTEPGGTTQSFEVVTPSEVATITLSRDLRSRDRTYLRVGESAILRAEVRLSDGRLALGLEGVLTVASSNPTTCAVVSLARLLGDGIFAVQARGEGQCRVEAKLGDRHASHLTRIAAPLER